MARTASGRRCRNRQSIRAPGCAAKVEPISTFNFSNLHLDDLAFATTGDSRTRSHVRFFSDTPVGDSGPRLAAAGIQDSAGDFGSRKYSFRGRGSIYVWASSGGEKQGQFE